MHIDCQVCPVRDSARRHCDDCVVQVFLSLPRVESAPPHPLTRTTQSARSAGLVESSTVGPLPLDEVESRAVGVFVSCGLLAQGEADTLVAWPARQGMARAVG
jgi:hypothetical protein